MSAYTEALKQGMQRVNQLTEDYAKYLEISQHGMAAVVRGELESARAYLQGLTDAGDYFIDEDNDTFFKETDDE